MLLKNRAPTIEPPSAPTIRPMPDRAANVPRRLIGTRSGMTADSGPCAKLKQICTSVHAMMNPTRVSANARPRSARAPATAPRIIHGARRPKRERVRSEIWPAMGCATIAANAPIVATMARLATLTWFSSPNASVICCGSRMPGTAPQIMNTLRFAGTIQNMRRRSPLMGGGGSSLPATVATKVFSDAGAVSSDDVVMRVVLESGLATRDIERLLKTIRH